MSSKTLRKTLAYIFQYNLKTIVKLIEERINITVCPVCSNEISQWYNKQAIQTGLGSTSKSITNHSQRAKANSELVKSGMTEENLINITGQSISSHKNMNEEHHEDIIKKMRDLCLQYGRDPLIALCFIEYFPICQQL